MPNARHSLEFIKYVATVVEPNGFDPGNLVGELQLVEFQLVMEFQGSDEILQKSTVRNLDRGTFGELFFVGTFEFSHDIT